LVAGDNFDYHLLVVIKGFFDNVGHEWMMKFLEHEIADKNLLRYIKRLLKAGIMEAGQFTEADSGVPQGGLCEASHSPPYAKSYTMQRNTSYTSQINPHPEFTLHSIKT